MRYHRRPMSRTVSSLLEVDDVRHRHRLLLDGDHREQDLRTRTSSSLLSICMSGSFEPQGSVETFLTCTGRPWAVEMRRCIVTVFRYFGERFGETGSGGSGKGRM